jgi:hypothetical protein
MSHGRFARSVGAAVLGFAFAACPYLLILHFGLRLSWRDAAVPLLLFTAVSAILFSGIVQVQKHKSLRIAACIFGAYTIVSFFLLAHYGSRWGFHTGFENGDLWRSAAFIVAIVIGVVLLPRQWSEGLFAEGVKCARCYHYHEGHDCSCGCRLDQFKWPSIGSGIP